MKLWLGYLTIVAVLALPASAGAATFDVNDDGNPFDAGPAGANCGDADYTTIQGAVADAAEAGDGINDTIRVCAGTYDELVAIITNHGLDLLGPQNGVDARTRATADEAVITDLGSDDGSITISADDVLIDGFTVEGEGSDPPDGGIVTNFSSSGQQLVNNIIRDNVLGIRLCNTSGDPTLVRHNLFEDNNAAGPDSGNAILSDCDLDDATIEDNKFTGHTNTALLTTDASGVEFSDNQLLGDAAVLFQSTTNATIAGNTFSDATTPAVVLNGGNGGVEVDRNRFTGGDFSSIQVVDAGPGPNANVSATGNTMLGDPVETSDTAFFVGAGGLSDDLQATFNRIAGNSTGATNNDAEDAVTAENNWWGCNEGPGQPGCDNLTGSGVINAAPWLVLGLTASPTSIPAGGASSQITASINRNSSGTVIGAGFPNQTPVGFATSLGSIGASALTSNAVAASTLSPGGTPGTAIVAGSLDSETAVTAVAITQPPAAAETPTKKKCKKKKKKKCKKGKAAEKK